METGTEKVAAAISRAQAALDEALAELAEVPAFDPGVTAFVAHGLKNYLTVTLGSIGLLQHALTGYADADVHRLLDGLDHTTHLMSTAVARLQGEEREPHFRSVEIDVRLLLHRAVSYYEKVAARKQIELTVERSDVLPPIWTDGVKVAAVLDNLLSNAIKYSPPGSRVQARVIREDDGVRLEIQDEGPGLSADDQARLFTRGSPLTPQPTGGESAHGYGLAVAKDLVEHLGGALRLHERNGPRRVLLVPPAGPPPRPGGGVYVPLRRDTWHRSMTGRPRRGPGAVVRDSATGAGRLKWLLPGGAR
ncbi:MAG: HAMP domain-containing sensor histidine kinase [Gemmataceae bacterium]